VRSSDKRDGEPDLLVTREGFDRTEVCLCWDTLDRAKVGVIFIDFALEVPERPTVEANAALLLIIKPAHLSS
jgi:hypothetical protein